MDTKANNTSRRELAIWCAGGMAIAFAPIAAASMAKPLDKGEKAFDLWKATRQTINAAPDDMDSGNDATRWSIVDRLETAIHGDMTATPRAAERKLWVALTHMTTDREDDAAVIRENLAHFQKIDASLDWNARLIVASIATLRRGRGEA